jgi:hypothetical protein
VLNETFSSRSCRGARTRACSVHTRVNALRLTSRPEAQIPALSPLVTSSMQPITTLPAFFSSQSCRWRTTVKIGACFPADFDGNAGVRPGEHDRSRKPARLPKRYKIVGRNITRFIPPRFHRCTRPYTIANMYAIADNAALLSALALAADRPKFPLRANGASRSERKTAVEFDEPPNPGCLKAIGFHSFSRTLFPCRAKRPRESYVP